MGNAAIRVVRATVLPLGIFVLWEVLVRIGYWPKTIIAPPTVVVPAFFRMLFDGVLLRHTAISATRLVFGLSIGVLVGVSVGAGVGVYRLVTDFLAPTLRFLAPIPVLAWIPVLIVTFGIDGSRVALIAIGTGLIVYSTTVSAIQDCPAQYIELARTYQKTRWQILMSVLLPAGAWDILSGCRVATALAWVLLLASELIASSSGIGWLIWDSRNFSRPDEMLVAMLFVGVLGFLTDMAIARSQARVANWRTTFHGV